MVRWSGGHCSGTGAIVQFFVDCANANLPQPRANLKEIALAVEGGMGVSSFEAGKKWHKSFLERHSLREEIRVDARSLSPRPFPSQHDKALGESRTGSQTNTPWWRHRTQQCSSPCLSPKYRRMGTA